METSGQEAGMVAFGNDKVSRLLREEKDHTGILQFPRDAGVGRVKKVAVPPGQEDGGLDHG